MREEFEVALARGFNEGLTEFSKQVDVFVNDFRQAGKDAAVGRLLIDGTIAEMQALFQTADSQPHEVVLCILKKFNLIDGEPDTRSAFSGIRDNAIANRVFHLFETTLLGNFQYVSPTSMFLYSESLMRVYSYPGIDLLSWNEREEKQSHLLQSFQLYMKRLIEGNDENAIRQFVDGLAKFRAKKSKVLSPQQIDAFLFQRLDEYLDDNQYEYAVVLILILAVFEKAGKPVVRQAVLAADGSAIADAPEKVKDWQHALRQMIRDSGRRFDGAPLRRLLRLVNPKQVFDDGDVWQQWFLQSSRKSVQRRQELEEQAESAPDESEPFDEESGCRPATKQDLTRQIAVLRALGDNDTAFVSLLKPCKGFSNLMQLPGVRAAVFNSEESIASATLGVAHIPRVKLSETMATQLRQMALFELERATEGFDVLIDDVVRLDVTVDEWLEFFAREVESSPHGVQNFLKNNAISATMFFKMLAQQGVESGTIAAIQAELAGSESTGIGALLGELELAEGFPRLKACEQAQPLVTVMRGFLRGQVYAHGGVENKLQLLAARAKDKARVGQVVPNLRELGDHIGSLVEDILNADEKVKSYMPELLENLQSRYPDVFTRYQQATQEYTQKQRAVEQQRPRTRQQGMSAAERKIAEEELQRLEHVERIAQEELQRATIALANLILQAVAEKPLPPVLEAVLKILWQASKAAGFPDAPGESFGLNVFNKFRAVTQLLGFMWDHVKCYGLDEYGNAAVLLTGLFHGSFESPTIALEHAAISILGKQMFKEQYRYAESPAWRMLDAVVTKFVDRRDIDIPTLQQGYEQRMECFVKHAADIPAEALMRQYQQAQNFGLGSAEEPVTFDARARSEINFASQAPDDYERWILNFFKGCHESLLPTVLQGILDTKPNLHGGDADGIDAWIDDIKNCVFDQLFDKRGELYLLAEAFINERCLPNLVNDETNRWLFDGYHAAFTRAFVQDVLVPHLVQKYIVPMFRDGDGGELRPTTEDYNKVIERLSQLLFEIEMAIEERYPQAKQFEEALEPEEEIYEAADPAPQPSLCWRVVAAPCRALDRARRASPVVFAEVATMLAADIAFVGLGVDENINTPFVSATVTVANPAMIVIAPLTQAWWTRRMRNKSRQADELAEVRRKGDISQSCKRQLEDYAKDLGIDIDQMYLVAPAQQRGLRHSIASMMSRFSRTGPLHGAEMRPPPRAASFAGTGISGGAKERELRRSLLGEHHQKGDGLTDPDLEALGGGAQRLSGTG